MVFTEGQTPLPPHGALIGQQGDGGSPMQAGCYSTWKNRPGAEIRSDSSCVQVQPDCQRPVNGRGELSAPVIFLPRKCDFHITGPHSALSSVFQLHPPSPSCTKSAVPWTALPCPGLSRTNPMGSYWTTSLCIMRRWVSQG